MCTLFGLLRTIDLPRSCSHEKRIFPKGPNPAPGNNLNHCYTVAVMISWIEEAETRRCPNPKQPRKTRLITPTVTCVTSNKTMPACLPPAWLRRDACTGPWIISHPFHRSSARKGNNQCCPCLIWRPPSIVVSRRGGGESRHVGTQQSNRGDLFREDLVQKKRSAISSKEVVRRCRVLHYGARHLSCPSLVRSVSKSTCMTS